MPKRNKLHYAVLCALATGATSNSLYAQDEATEEEGSRELKRIEVTATKTAATDMQEAAIAVDAMDAQSMNEMNIGSFEDLVQYQPKITTGSRGPGQSTVFLRGMAVQPITVLLSAAQGTSPNVAIYLDEQPVSAPGRNLDVYTTDLARVEVLPGPQGTLFGASSQAGTIRYITNKPDPFGFDAGFTTRFSSTKDGEPSQSVEGFMNLPITDDFATRIAFYNVQKGGYIDNVEGTFTLDPDVNPESAVDLGEDAIYETATNADIAEEDFNDSSYKGLRVSGLYEFNQDWSLLVQNTWQELGADGVFDYDPAVGDLDVERFFPDELEDTFNQTTWTLDGRLGMLDLVYTGGYLDRDVEQSVDYTGYNNAGAFIAYYTCTYDNPDYIVNYGIDPDVITENRHCLDPTKGTKIDQSHERNTHEFRFSTPQDNALRFVGGVFYDDLTIETIDDFHYFAGMPGGGEALGFAPNTPFPDANNINPNTRPPTVAFFNDITRTEEQLAFFGEMSYDFTPKLTGTVGLRHYDIESGFTGSSNFANGIFQGSEEPPFRGRNYDESGGHSTEKLTTDGVVPKFNLSYDYTPNVKFYATYSEGFRPGGFNRGGGLESNNPDFPTTNTTYGTDDVVNKEFGWKTMLFENSLRWNGNIYHIDWTDMQISRFDPVNVSILTFIENGADSEIFGMESDLTWRATDNLTLYGAISYNDTELTDTNARAIELVPVGSELALVPEFQANARARYEWRIDSDFVDYAHWQVGARYASEAWSSLVAEERREQDSYAIADMSVGVSKDEWGLSLYASNVTDERAQLFINTQDDIERVTTNRPRTIGLKLSYRYQP